MCPQLPLAWSFPLEPCPLTIFHLTPNLMPNPRSPLGGGHQLSYSLEGSLHHVLLGHKAKVSWFLGAS